MVSENKTLTQSKETMNDQDDWVIFQNEIDSVRDVVLMYKTKQCNLNCANVDCFFFHNPQEKRRKPFNNNGKLVYLDELCNEGANCKAEDCNKSHNFYELNYHPWRFKTKPCEYFLNSNLTLNSSLSFNTKPNTSNNKIDSNLSSFRDNSTNSNFFNNNNNSNSLNSASRVNSSLMVSENNNTNDSNKQINSKLRLTDSSSLMQSNHNEKLCPYYHSQEQRREIKNNTMKSKRKSMDDSNSTQLVESQFCKLDLNIFKVFKCSNQNKHSEKQCLYYHSMKDRRRSQNQFYYLPEICFAVQSDQKCQHGDYCNKSHNQVEMFYHKDKFRTKFCSHYNEEKDINEVNNDCPYGTFCSFAHCEREIRVDLIHKLDKNLDFFIYYFKTVVCPFDHKHDKSICEYSHNLQDFRRNPKKYIYDKKNCSKWDNKKTILCYSDGCPDGYSCIYCHGWKELDFHPLNYKTTKCKNYRGNCEKGSLCPFYHTFENKR